MAKRLTRKVCEDLVARGMEDNGEALLEASEKGFVEAVKGLVEEGADLDVKYLDYRTPLIVAAKGSHLEVCELLINAGVDGNSSDNMGWTALHHAASNGCLEIVQCLVSNKVELDMKNRNGETPLLLAARCSRVKVCTFLIDSGASIQCRDNMGWTVLHKVVVQGFQDIVQSLILKKVALNVKDHYGDTPLHFAVRISYKEVTHYLLKAGADCNSRNNENESPFSSLLNKVMPKIEFIMLCIEFGGYVKPTDYKNLLLHPFLKEVILHDAKVSSKIVINKFNNEELPKLYEWLPSTQILPPIDQMKIGHESARAQQVEQECANDIQVNGLCNVLKMAPSVLSILCVKASINKLIPAYNRLKLSQSKTCSKRLEGNLQKRQVGKRSKK